MVRLGVEFSPIAILVFLFVIGAATRSPGGFIAVVLVPVHSLGLLAGWWGYGVGEYWEPAMVMAMLVASAVVLAGLLTGIWVESMLGRRAGS